MTSLGAVALPAEEVKKAHNPTLGFEILFRIALTMFAAVFAAVATMVRAVRDIFTIVLSSILDPAVREMRRGIHSLEDRKQEGGVSDGYPFEARREDMPNN